MKDSENKLSGSMHSFKRMLSFGILMVIAMTLFAQVKNVSGVVLDPCPWGLRTYYYGCTREGGHSGWLNDNLKEAENAPEFYGVTAKWTFNGKWDPEQRIRDLWNVLAY